MEFTRKGLCIWQQHCLCMCTLYEYIHCSAMYSACANVTSLVHFNVSKHSTLAIEAVFIYTMPNLCKQVGVTSHSIAQAAHTLCTQASSISVFSALVLTSQPVPLRNHFGCQSREWYNTLVKKPPCLGSLLEWEKNTTFVPQQHEVCTFCVHTESTRYTKRNWNLPSCHPLNQHRQRTEIRVEKFKYNWEQSSLFNSISTLTASLSANRPLEDLRVVRYIKGNSDALWIPTISLELVLSSVKICDLDHSNHWMLCYFNLCCLILQRLRLITFYWHFTQWVQRGGCVWNTRTWGWHSKTFVIFAQPNTASKKQISCMNVLFCSHEYWTHDC